MARVSRQTAVKILEKNGIEPQKNKCVEECSELIRALMRNDKENVKEEIADVLITTTQMIIAYGINDDELQTIINNKEYRTLVRLGLESEPLHPCPFCNSIVTVRMIPGSCDYMYTVECDKCGSSIKLYETEAEAIKAWNNRP